MYMKFITEYDDSKTSFLNIDNIIKEYEEILLEANIGDWLLRAPKVRKAQEKANAKRLEAVYLEAKQRRDIDDAVEKGKKVDKGRMWKLLQDKLDALEEMAKEYEEESIAASAGNDYLRKVRRVTRLKGVIKMNKEKIAVAEGEEKRELTKQNKEYKKIIGYETKDINDKIKDDKDRLAAEKRKGKDKKDDDDDSYGDYFQAKKAEKGRK